MDQLHHTNDVVVIPPPPPKLSSQLHNRNNIIISNDKIKDSNGDFLTHLPTESTPKVSSIQTSSSSPIILDNDDSSNNYDGDNNNSNSQNYIDGDDEDKIPLLTKISSKNQNQIQNLEKERHSKWPLPFNDESAIQNQKLIPINADDEVIINDISIRVITWNQQAKPIPAPNHHEEVYKQLFLHKAQSNSVDKHDDHSHIIDEDKPKNIHEERRKDYSNNIVTYHHLIVIGTQECENSISKSILNPIKEKWEKSCIEALGDNYVFLQGHALQASHLAVFAHKSIIHTVSQVQSHAVPTGICNKLGNKGGIGISLHVGKTSFCFLTAHLSAFQDQIDRRTLEFELISNEIAKKLGRQSAKRNKEPLVDNNHVNMNESLSQTIATSSSLDESDHYDTSGHLDDNYQDDKKSDSSKCCCRNSYCSIYCCCCRDQNDHDHANPLLKQFDYVFWGGDLNYRINATRDVVDSLLEENRHDVLVANDQLSLLLQFEKTFKGFIEGPLTFRPTYKYDLGSDMYDTSSKRRVPSWTDRILYKNDPRVELLSYFCAQEIRTSDHRPVVASFSCKLSMDPSERSSSERNELRSESRSEVCVIS